MRAHSRPHFVQKAAGSHRFFNVVVYTASFAVIDLGIARKKNRYFYVISRHRALFVRFCSF